MSPSELNSYSQIKEKAKLVFKKVSENIFEVVKDRMGEYERYATSEQVVNALNLVWDTYVVDENNQVIAKKA